MAQMMLENYYIIHPSLMYPRVDILKNRLYGMHICLYWYVCKAQITCIPKKQKSRPSLPEKVWSSQQVKGKIVKKILLPSIL